MMSLKITSESQALPRKFQEDSNLPEANRLSRLIGLSHAEKAMASIDYASV